MSLISVVQDVCAVVGVTRPSSIFSGLNSSRTQQELLALANEMAQRIAYNTREWTAFTAFWNPDAVSGIADPKYNQTGFALPADFKRLLLTSNLWRPAMPQYPMRFIADHDEWTQRRLWGWFDYRGEWIKVGEKIYVAPALLPVWVNSRAYAIGDRVSDASGWPDSATYWQAAVKHTSAATGTFAAARAANPALWTALTASGTSIGLAYLTRNCINLAGGGVGDVFTNDNDSFRLDERLLKLGMVWQWKANKGSPYAEDMGTYSDALAVASGADKPAPIIIGRMPISAAANVAIPWPPGWGPQP
jgi:hypothetical protein